MSERPPPLLERVSTWVAIGGAALGLASVATDQLGPRWVGNLAAVWFAAGFLAGLTTRSKRRGAWLGVLALTTATLAYYGLRLAAAGPFSFEDLVPIPAGWLVIGIASGAVAGSLGTLARTQPAAWGAPAGIFLGEAAAVIVLRQRVSQAVVEAVCAAVCVWFARAAWPRALVVVAATVPYVAGFAAAYRIFLW